MCNPVTSRTRNDASAPNDGNSNHSNGDNTTNRMNSNGNDAIDGDHVNINNHDFRDADSLDVEMGDASHSASHPSHEEQPTTPSKSRSRQMQTQNQYQHQDDPSDACSVGTFSKNPLTKAASNDSNSNSNSNNNPTNANSDTGLGSAFLSSLPPSHQMLLLSFLMFLFFGLHNILQEAIVHLLSSIAPSSSPLSPLTPQLVKSLQSEGTVMLGYAEVTGVLLFSYLERVYVAKEEGLAHAAPLGAYSLLTLCLFASSTLCNASLSYINFPTKVVFRSCKLVPTMLIATIVNKRRFASYEYACALSICAGLVLFALADYRLDPVKLNGTGLALVSGSVVADAILPNAQERLFRRGSSRLEVTVWSNFFSFVAMTVMTNLTGTLRNFCLLMYYNRTVALYVGVYTVLSYVSISCYMTLVKRFGGVAAVLLTTARKAMTLVLSFMLFPKGFSWLYVHGSLLVLGAVMVASIFKKLGIGKEGGRDGRKSGFGTSKGGRLLVRINGYGISANEVKSDDDTSSSSGSNCEDDGSSCEGGGKSAPQRSDRKESFENEQVKKSILKKISKRVYV
mmetsp:Transcript_26204/g.54851  ORF Transcript_26204/g.54851 Transcript_26204/m.54851 type:complete len:566 (-) Transcript_26204:53-1750(-)